MDRDTVDVYEAGADVYAERRRFAPIEPRRSPPRCRRASDEPTSGAGLAWPCHTSGRRSSASTLPTPCCTGRGRHCVCKRTWLPCHYAGVASTAHGQDGRTSISHRGALPLALADLHHATAVGAPVSLSLFAGDGGDHRRRRRPPRPALHPLDTRAALGPAHRQGIDVLGIDVGSEPDWPSLRYAARRAGVVARRVGPGHAAAVSAGSTRTLRGRPRCGLCPAGQPVLAGPARGRPGHPRPRPPRTFVRPRPIGMTDLVKRATAAPPSSRPTSTRRRRPPRAAVHWLRPGCALLRRVSPGGGRGQPAAPRCRLAARRRSVACRCTSEDAEPERPQRLDPVRRLPSTTSAPAGTPALTASVHHDERHPCRPRSRPSRPTTPACMRRAARAGRHPRHRSSRASTSGRTLALLLHTRAGRSSARRRHAAGLRPALPAVAQWATDTRLDHPNLISPSPSPASCRRRLPLPGGRVRRRQLDDRRDPRAAGLGAAHCAARVRVDVIGPPFGGSSDLGRRHPDGGLIDGTSPVASSRSVPKPPDAAHRGDGRRFGASSACPWPARCSRLEVQQWAHPLRRARARVRRRRDGRPRRAWARRPRRPMPDARRRAPRCRAVAEVRRSPACFGSPRSVFADVTHPSSACRRRTCAGHRCDLRSAVSPARPARDRRPPYLGLSIPFWPTACGGAGPGGAFTLAAVRSSHRSRWAQGSRGRGHTAVRHRRLGSRRVGDVDAVSCRYSPASFVAVFAGARTHPWRAR